ncbi:MAG TPA: pyruvate kinase [Phycisphaerae bacterium]|nr:pyruvate kinase [Phycisphaerae bacterium]HRY70619.1 pyruvate kinase [Phycisphaerae bacterium]HSA28932.1 pyruvate kinase [Phycisphaerae bacterium]
MSSTIRRTKIVATLGPASNSAVVIRQLIQAGMDVARFNFSHGSYDDHARTLACLREASGELDRPVTILQDLQGPKIRVGQLPPPGQIQLDPGADVTLVPLGDFKGEPATIPIDYPHLAEEARPDMQVLLADGAFELRIVRVAGDGVQCRVIQGGALKSRKGVNFPDLRLRLPSLTPKDVEDLEFGLSLNVDVVSLSFVRSAEDVRALKSLIADKGLFKPVVAKIEKPQAIEHLDEIVEETNCVMVARGDLGVEMSAEKVPLLQKHIIEKCNRRGKPVITATQMLESMIQEPRPTRAEASDVANAIIDGTDAVMLSGETAVGAHPVQAVEMMARIAVEVEEKIEFKNYPPTEHTQTHALTEAIRTVEQVLQPRCIVVLTASGYAAGRVASERPRSPVFAVTTQPRVYHALNLVWGLRPLLIDRQADTFESLTALAEATLRERQLVASGDTILILGGIPAMQPRGTNFLKVHRVT